MTTVATALAANGPSPSRTVRAIAAVEARRLLRHPVLLVGLAGSIAMQPLGSGAEEWPGQDYEASMMAWTLLWVGTLLASAMVAGRQRLLADVELFPATPATGGARVRGVVLALIGPALVAAVAVVAMIALTASRGGFVHGDEGYARRIMPHALEWAQPVLLVVLAGAVGIAAAQLRRGRLGAVLVAGLSTFFGGLAVWAFQGHPIRLILPFMFPMYEERLPRQFTPTGWGPGSAPLRVPDEFSNTWQAVHFDTTALGWHLVYVSGLIVVAVWAATRMADRGEHRSARPLGVTGLILVVVGGVAQLVTAGVNA